MRGFCYRASAHELFPRLIDGYKKCKETHGLSVYAVEDKESDEIIGASAKEGPTKLIIRQNNKTIAT